MPGTYQMFTAKAGETVKMPYDCVVVTKPAWDVVTRIKDEDLRKTMEKRLRELREPIPPAVTSPVAP